MLWHRVPPGLLHPGQHLELCGCPLHKLTFWGEGGHLGLAALGGFPCPSWLAACQHLLQPAGLGDAASRALLAGHRQLLRRSCAIRLPPWAPAASTVLGCCSWPSLTGPGSFAGGRQSGSALLLDCLAGGSCTPTAPAGSRAEPRAPRGLLLRNRPWGWHERCQCLLSPKCLRLLTSGRVLPGLPGL